VRLYHTLPSGWDSRRTLFVTREQIGAVTVTVDSWCYLRHKSAKPLDTSTIAPPFPNMSRLSPKTRDEYPPEQQGLVEQCHQFVERAFGQNGETFIYQDSRGALIGPFPFLLYDPRTAQPLMDLIAGMAKMGFPPDARDTTILTVGAKFQAGFELYSHVAGSIKAGVLSEEQAETLRMGKKPADLNEQCSVAYDAASCLLNTPGPLPQSHWDKLVATFGRDGTVAWVQHVGFYCYVCMILNSIDAPVPE
jgi:4-carboxymuconolactone decarboxylase